MESDVAIYLAKAAESLTTAESEFINSCANRCYYACFQAAIAALIQEGIRPRGSGSWGHDFVQGQFIGQLINRRKRYDSSLRNILPETQHVRDKADYRAELINQTQASRALSRSRKFVSAIQQHRGDIP